MTMEWLSLTTSMVCLFEATFGSQEPLGFFEKVFLQEISSAATKFTTLRHSLYPRYSVRVKKTNFCDRAVGEYTGYIDIEARLYFFDSRRNATEYNVILWTNGCSGASMGLFKEIGPSRVAASGDRQADNLMLLCGARRIREYHRRGSKKMSRLL
ncbi:hypothetical protein BDY19DRAFT_322021 [Irpex rosettiformis]|uniref:Uncharacterized protein n=1 Tax=Irpex rosettiformis TaxID=378272 RepID=A0ACB8TY47_9APHY|nr:hypothetical protein BDY19DRAFT_322021 [Irpex rosettiformis]